MPNAFARSLLGLSFSLAGAALIASGPVLARDVTPAQADAAPHQAGDVDGDGLPEATSASQSKFKAGKALADTVKHSGQADGASRSDGQSNPQAVPEGNGMKSTRAGDPIPGIDITVSQAPASGK